MTHDYIKKLIILRLLESLDDCASMQDSIYLLETTKCVKKVCEKMDSWCCGEGLDDVYEDINKKYETLQNAEYLGEQLPSIKYKYAKTYHYRS